MLSHGPLPAPRASPLGIPSDRPLDEDHSSSALCPLLIMPPYPIQCPNTNQWEHLLGMRSTLCNVIHSHDETTRPATTKASPRSFEFLISTLTNCLRKSWFISDKGCLLLSVTQQLWACRHLSPDRAPLKS